MSLTPYYQDEAVTIYHGDVLDVLPTLDETVDLVVTDPPYFQPSTHYVPPRAEKPIRSLGDTSVLLHAMKAWATEIDRVTDVQPSLFGEARRVKFLSFLSLSTVPLVDQGAASANQTGGLLSSAPSFAQPFASWSSPHPHRPQR